MLRLLIFIESMKQQAIVQSNYAQCYLLSALDNLWVLGCRQQRLIHEFACWTICLNNNSLASSLVSSIAVALLSPAAKEINLATAAAADDPRLKKEGRERERN